LSNFRGSLHACILIYFLQLTLTHPKMGWLKLEVNTYAYFQTYFALIRKVRKAHVVVQSRLYRDIVVEIIAITQLWSEL